MFNKVLFKNTILFLILAELFSLVSYIYPSLNVAVFWVVLALVFVIAWQRLEWALYIVIAELLIGSFGQLFYIDFEGTLVSLRIGIFVVVMAVWFGKSVVSGFGSLVSLIKDFFVTKIGRWYGLLAIALLWGLGWGMIRNEFADVFLDFNNWLYFLYILPFYDVFVVKKLETVSQRKDNDIIASGDATGFPVKLGMTEKKNEVTKNLLTILAGSIIILSFKTLILEWFFAHQSLGTMEMLYRWIRDFRLGEITFYAQNFYRVFIQSHIWLLFNFFIFLGLYFYNVTHKWESGSVSSLKDCIIKFFVSFRNKKNNNKENRWLKFILVLAAVTLLISFSRSLWLGWIAGLFVFGLILIFKFRVGFRQTLKWISFILGLFVVSGLVIFLVVTVPPVRDGGDLGSLLADRVTVIEAAGSSRINLLKPLMLEIAEHPVIGSGFGSTVTYRSVDPRILGSTAGASGEYTTYAFEWAYLDIMLKIGLAGLLVYLGLLWQLIVFAWRRLTEPLVLGLFLALVSLLVVNITTPYLNHPLGIGFIILMTVWCFQFTLQTNRADLE